MVDIMSTVKLTRLNPRKDRVPDLCQLSDVWWLSWMHIAKSAEPVRYVVRRHLHDEDMHDLFRHVLVKHGVKSGDPLAWPGTILTPNMDGFDAIVGSASVWGVVQLFIQKSKVLGRQEIQSFAVYREDPNAEAPVSLPSLLIEIGAIES